MFRYAIGPILLGAVACAGPTPAPVTPPVDPAAQPQPPGNQAARPAPPVEDKGLEQLVGPPTGALQPSPILVVGGTVPWPPADRQLKSLGNVALLTLDSERLSIVGGEGGERIATCKEAACFAELGAAAEAGYVLALSADTAGRHVDLRLVQVAPPQLLSHARAPLNARIWDKLGNYLSAASGELLPVQSFGTVDPVLMSDALEQIKGKMRACYRGLFDPNAKGQVAVTFVLAADGQAERVIVTSSIQPSQKARDCVTRIVRSMQFPKPEGGVEIVQFDLAFVPAE